MDKCVLKIINSATKELVKEIACDTLDEAEHYREQIFLTVYKERRKRVFMGTEYN